MSKNKNRGKIFTKISDTGYIFEDENGTAKFEEKIHTFSLVKKENKFVLFELERRKKPRRIRSFKAVKGLKRDVIIKKIQNDEVKIKTKNEERLGYRGTKIIQTNYVAKIKSFVQLVGVVKVVDNRRHIEDFFVAYSNKVPTIDASRLSKMKNQLKTMAIGKFITTYGMARKSEDITAQIIQIRYQYHKIPKSRWENSN